MDINSSSKAIEMVVSLYENMIRTKSGAIRKYSNHSQLKGKWYPYFVKLVDRCEELVTKPKNYMEAQFMLFRGNAFRSYPIPPEMVSKKALDRWKKWSKMCNSGETVFRPPIVVGDLTRDMLENEEYFLGSLEKHTGISKEELVTDLIVRQSLSSITVKKYFRG